MNGWVPDLIKMKKQYDALGQVTSGKKYWADGTPVAGQQFEYDFDDIGNRQRTASGGDAAGANLQAASYTANNLNQSTRRDVPGVVTLLGSAHPNATVTVNNQRAGRQGDYFWADLGVDNTGAARWLSLTNLAVLNNGSNPDLIATNLGNRFVARTPELFSYDADGNLTNDGRFSYVWDAENRLTSLTSQADAPAASQVKLEFAYDYGSRRVQKLVSTHNGTAWVPVSTNKFVYDGWNLIAILNPQSSILQSFTWGLDLSGSLHGAGGVGGLLSLTVAAGTNAGTYFYGHDGNGNVAALINSADGTATARYEYDPFGQVLRATGPLAQANPFRFSTKYQDDETALTYYGYRYYVPSMGNWLSRDPLGETGGKNLLSFVRNHPVSGVDSLGLALYAFDGTGQNGNGKPEIEQTWVSILRNGYEGNKVYEPGVGSAFGTRIIGGATGLGNRSRLEDAYKEFLRIYGSGDHDVDIIGFSRGAAEAREFANMLSERGYNPDYIRFYNKNKPGCPVKIRFIGLFDTVNKTFGNRLDIPSDVEMVRQATAQDERRSSFPLTSLNDPLPGQDFEELPFPGDHSDIGHGHGLDSNELSYAPLIYIWSEGRNKGVPFGPLPSIIYTGNTTPHDLSSSFPWLLFPTTSR